MRAIRCQIHLKRYFHVSCFHYESDVKQGFDASRIAEKFNELNSLKSLPTKPIVLHGWVQGKPKKISKMLSFANLRDISGELIQLVDSNYPSFIRSLKPESAVAVEGETVAHIGPKGEKKLEFHVSGVKVVNQASSTASDLTTSNTKEWPPEYRYLQLRQVDFQQMFRTRASVMSVCRKVLDTLGFLEIETPLLFKSTPEGAREFLVPTRKRGYMYALPQSPQQYKQLLMASGVHRYYQLAKCFRDEDLRKDRQPEFTQLDMEMAFSNGVDVMQTIEKVVTNVWSFIFPSMNLYTLDKNSCLKSVSSSNKISSISYSDAISRYGIDKPDLRCSIEIQNLLDYAEATLVPDFPVLEAVVLKGLNANSTTNFNFICKELTKSSDYTSRLPRVFKIGSSTAKDIDCMVSELSSFCKIKDRDGLLKVLDLQVGDIVAFSTRQIVSFENPTPLGRFRQLAYEKFPELFVRLKLDGNPVGKDEFVANWVVDFPLFSPVEIESSSRASTAGYPSYDFSSLCSTHHPFTMANLHDIELLETDPLAIRGQHYDLVVNGVELGGGSTRIHDAELQKYIFEHILGIYNSEKLFGHLLQAFSTGCPPHAGFAIGFDRMVAMLCGSSSLRDVIAFPKTVKGFDPLIGSPSRVNSKQISPYHVSII